MHRYIGSGPYCYANSLAMTLGPGTPPPAVIETLTGSPFGVQLIGGTLPFFDPYAWDPEQGLDAAVELLGARCERTSGGTPREALARLRAACAHAPVLVGPVDMGLLLFQPGTPAPVPAPGEGGGVDHYVVVLAVDGDTVLLHDPHGHPYATLPTGAFLAAWRADAVDYTDVPYVLRAGFVREREVTEEEALRRSLPRAAAWLAGRADVPVPAGTLGGAAAVEELAALVEGGLAPATRALLTEFGVQVGARRLADAAGCLAALGLPGAAAVADGQSRLVGSLQLPLVTGDDRTAATVLRRLAPTYERLRSALAAAVGSG
ncbi:hypothetical protein [Streptomyces sp. NPDC020965]|uniref:hypothetical protein n=1 Tax=Streptomyces sp. NPDC020965 TaxID=3365105 RepID=UPI00378774EB